MEKDLTVQSPMAEKKLVIWYQFWLMLLIYPASQKSQLKYFKLLLKDGLALMQLWARLDIGMLQVAIDFLAKFV